MSVFNKSFYALVAASLAFGIVGCGGGGNGSQPPTLNSTVPLRGGVVTQTAPSPVAITAGATETTIPVTVSQSSSPVNIIVPAGVAVNAGQSLAIIPAGTQFIQGMEGGARGGPGTLTINGVPVIGSRILNGLLTVGIGLPAGNYDVALTGPWRITGSTGIGLNVNTFEFIFESNGHVTSLPTHLGGNIPANGSDNWQNSITTEFNATYGTGTAKLLITHENGTLNKTVGLASGVATFKQNSNSAAAQIPRTGVNLVQFSH